MGRDKIDSKLKELALCIELGDFSRASDLLSKLSSQTSHFTPEDVKKFISFLDFYSERVKVLERELQEKLSNKSKVDKSYLR